MGIPINISDNDIYLRWRDEKLEKYPRSIEDLTVKITTPGEPNKHNIEKLKALCLKSNMVIYKAPEEIIENKNIALNMGISLGLQHIERSLTTENDGVSELSVIGAGVKSHYIPYTDKRLGWHTDGCYNDTNNQINGFILHCVRAAKDGGENHLLDPDIAYILLRDENPEFIEGLMLDDALTIPQNKENGIILRKKQTGPVLTIQKNNLNTGIRAIHFRYTSRQTFVLWNKDTRTQGALDFLKKTLQARCPYIFRIKLQPGSGIIGNNILHNRTKFKNGESKAGQRLFYRIYYKDRI